MKKLIGILSILSILSCFSIEINAQILEQDTFYVWANDGLNMRKEASAKGEKLSKIPFGTALTVETYEGDNYGIKDEYGMARGTWALVKYKEHKGYVFSGYLDKIPTPTKGESDETYFMRVYGPVQASYETVHSEQHRSVNLMLKHGVNIHTEYFGEDKASGIIFMPELDHRLMHLLVDHLYAVPRNFKKEGFVHKFDKKANLITIEEKDGDAGCYFRIQLLFGATGGEKGVAITQYCGC